MPARRNSGYEVVEHTADVGLRAYAPTLRELFEQAAAGMIELMVDPQSVRPQRTVPLSAQGETPEELLVAWLSEILYAFDARGLAPAQASVLSLSQGQVSGELAGEDFDPARHTVRNAIKAVTYHGLRVEATPEGHSVTVIFDV